MNLPSHLTNHQGSHNVIIAAYNDGSPNQSSRPPLQPQSSSLNTSATPAHHDKNDADIDPDAIMLHHIFRKGKAKASKDHTGRDYSAGEGNDDAQLATHTQDSIEQKSGDYITSLEQYQHILSFSPNDSPLKAESLTDKRGLKDTKDQMPFPSAPALAQALAAAPPASLSDRLPDDQRKGRLHRFITKTKIVLKRHMAFVGPGLVASVGYTDPGNWVTDLAAGSQFGYALLFIVLCSGLVGIFLQILAVRMGVVTGNDLARNTRLWLLPDEQDGSRLRSRHSSTTAQHKPPRFRTVRVIALWLMYLVSEAAIVATELAELLGSAIALNLLFPGLPLWGGVLITCADVMLILFIYRPDGGNFRVLEVFIAALVFIVLGCYIALLIRVRPYWPDVFHGYVPSSTLIQHDALYTGIGIIGAVIMPHALFLGSHFSTLNRTHKANVEISKTLTTSEADQQEALQDVPMHQRMLLRLRTFVADTIPSIESHLRPGGMQRQRDSHAHSSHDGDGIRNIPRIPSSQQVVSQTNKAMPYSHRMSIADMQVHLPHAAWDIALSLFFFAITVNSAILIVAAAAFYYGSGSRDLSDLYDAFNLLRETLGKPYAILFAIGLLAAGQSASITCTLAGQIVSEGFINWRTNPFVRRLITRFITMVPAMGVAIGVGRDGLDNMLIGSQVTLSFALPFVLVPLICVTSLKSKMLIEEEVDQEAGLVVGNGGDGSYMPAKKGTDAKQTIAEHINVQSPTSADAIMHAAQSPMATPLQSASSAAKQDVEGHDDKISLQQGRNKPITQPEQLSHAPASLQFFSRNFANHWTAVVFAVIVYVVLLLADMYTLVTTIMGDS